MVQILITHGDYNKIFIWSLYRYEHKFNESIKKYFGIA